MKSLIYIEYNTNSGYKWTPQEVIDLYMLYITVRGPGQYNTNSNIFFINTRENQELPEVKPGTSGLLAFGCPTEPSTPSNMAEIGNNFKNIFF